MSYRRRLKMYKKKYRKDNYHPLLDRRYYVDFIEQETPIHIDSLNKRNEIVNLMIFKGAYQYESFTLWVYLYKDGYIMNGQLVHVRFDYNWNKLIYGKTLKQWLPKTFWYEPNPTFGFKSNQEKFNIMLTDLELIDYIEEYFDSFPYYDLRRIKNYSNQPIIIDNYVEEPSNIYFIFDEIQRTTKIGRSQYPNTRKSQINSDSASTITLIMSIQSNHAKILDVLLQNHFAYKRSKQEWYHLNKKDIERLLSRALPNQITELMGEVNILANSFDNMSPLTNL
ncbi:GIY-YIG nuclease family protein [Brevibacillus choshinensis]|uniref:GIY-YIG nuclease family protein n=1 Tax=Brevibacillus choshinensis TaxID=54911 RepID=UPI002E1EB5AB|nr:GIY-YIG nuclease family protein [Brevibacillus choshinensis]